MAVATHPDKVFTAHEKEGATAAFQKVETGFKRIGI